MQRYRRDEHKRNTKNNKKREKQTQKEGKAFAGACGVLCPVKPDHYLFDGRTITGQNEKGEEEQEREKKRRNIPEHRKQDEIAFPQPLQLRGQCGGWLG